MKSFKIALKIVVLFLSFSVFFSDILIINNIHLSVINMYEIYGICMGNLLVLIPFIIFFIASSILLFAKKDTAAYKCSCLLFMVSSILFLFIKKFFLFDMTVRINISLGLCPIIMSIFSLIIFVCLLIQIRECLKFSVKDIVEIGIFVSFAIVLDLQIFKIRLGSNGGSISFAMVPLFIICLRKEFYKGFVSCGIIYGLITCLLDGYGIFTFPFDYLLGFGSIAVSGLFSKSLLNNKITISSYIKLLFIIVLSGSLRTLSATISGIIFYKLSFWPSLVYQLTYIGPSLGIVTGVLFVLFRPLKRINIKY